MKHFPTLAALLLALPALGEDAKLSPLSLALNWKAEPEFGGFYATKLSGNYEKRGFEVEITEGGAGTPVIQMVAAGKVEYGIASADEVVISQSKGSDVVALFAVYETNPQGVMAHPDRGFKSIGDLFRAPGTLAIQTGAPFTLFLTSRFPKPAVKIVPYAGGVTHFLSDPKFSQQCFVTSEPLVAKKKGKATQVFLIANEGFNPYAALVVARKKTIENDPARAKAFVEATREGWAEYLDSPEAANAWMGKLNPSIDAETMMQISKIQAPFVTKSKHPAKDVGKMTLERWATLVQQLSDLKLVKGKPDPKGLFKDL